MIPNLKLILGVVGNGTALALFLSPLPTFKRIVESKSTEDFSALPYVCTVFNCALWLLYGLPFVKPHSVLILTINAFGFALELGYIAIFLAFAARKTKVAILRYLGLELAVYVGILVVVVLALHSHSLRQLVVGSICVLVTLTMYASPLSVMGMVIRTRSVQYMPFLLSLFNFLNGLIWTLYSIVTRDIFIAIPNGLGTLSGIAQLIIYAIYRNANPINVKTPDPESGGRKPVKELAMPTAKKITTAPITYQVKA